MNSKSPFEDLMQQFEQVLAESVMSKEAQIASMERFREQAAKDFQALIDRANKDADK